MSENIIEKIDPNMRAESSLGLDDIRFYNPITDADKGFKLYGFYDVYNQPVYKRLPDDIATATNVGVLRLYTNTAGGRVRFSTDSAYVSIKVKMPGITHLAHMPLTGTSGFDLYVDTDSDSCFSGLFKPPVDITNGYEAVVKFKTAGTRNITINFPSYNNVDELLIGLQSTASVGEGLAYINSKPIIYYGSSITQGACSSRPGLTYQNIIAKRTNFDYINLGFSGNARAEDSIAGYMASMPMSVFVSDYDHNAPNTEHLKATHYKLYETIRAANPTVPYLMISRPDFSSNRSYGIRQRNVIIDSYRAARAAGDENVYFIDGEGFYRNTDEDLCSVDGSHPNDLGFLKMADHIGRVLTHIIRVSDIKS